MLDVAARREPGRAELLFDRIDRVRRREKRVALTVGFLRMALAVVLGVVAFFLLDWFLVSTGGERAMYVFAAVFYMVHVPALLSVLARRLTGSWPRSAQATAVAAVPLGVGLAGALAVQGLGVSSTAGLVCWGIVIFAAALFAGGAAAVNWMSVQPKTAAVCVGGTFAGSVVFWTCAVVVALALGEAFEAFEAFEAETAARVAMWMGLLGGLGYALEVNFLRELRRIISDDEVAIRVENRHSELRGRLISTVQLARVGEDSPYVGSQELIRALEEDTVSATSGVNFAEIVSLETLKWIGVVAGLVILLCAAGGLTNPDFVRALLARMALMDASYPTSTRIVKVTGDGKVARGEDFAVEVVCEGYLPEEGVLYVVAGGREDELVLKGEGTPKYGAKVPRVMEPFDYRAEVYDARSESFHVNVVTRPAVSDVRVRYVFPAYTGLSEKGDAAGDVSALVGTKVTIAAELTKVVAEARMVVSTEVESTALSMKLAEVSPERVPEELRGAYTATEFKARSKDWKVRKGSFTVAWADYTVERDGTYRIELLDKEGMTNPLPPEYIIDARPDRAPSCRLERPRDDKTVTRFACWPVRFTARDDFGVGKAWLRFEIGETPPKQQEIELGESRGARAVLGQLLWDLSPLKLQVDDVVTFWVEVCDNKSPQPNFSEKREERRFTVVSVEEKRAELARRRSEALRKVSRLARDETGSRRAVQSIIERLRAGRLLPEE